MLSYSGKVYSALIINRRTAINSTPIFSQRTPAGARTLDTLIKSQVLYQLSYKRNSYFCGAKVVILILSTKYFSI